MALVTQIKKTNKSRHTIHKPTTCDYSIFVGDDGEQYLQIDTYGSSERELAGKISQSIQFNRDSASQLRALIDNHFGAG
ncbi:MAG: methionyl-tRNA formyltransferase [Planctomycetota bacterium]